MTATLLTDPNRKEELSLAYVKALAAPGFLDRGAGARPGQRRFVDPGGRPPPSGSRLADAAVARVETAAATDSGPSQKSELPLCPARSEISLGGQAS